MFVILFPAKKSTVNERRQLEEHCTDNMAPSPKTFASDDTVLDPAIKSHISSLYMAVDTKDLEFWGSHFTEDAELKKGTSNVRGRESKHAKTLAHTARLAMTNQVQIARRTC